MSTDTLDGWLSGLPKTAQGYAQISSVRSYLHPESGYDTQYAINPESLVCGQGLIKLLHHHQLRAESLLEIGCGTGNLTLGYCAEKHFSQCLVTDPSEAFLDITAGKLSTLRKKELLQVEVNLAVLDGEDVGLLPAGAVSVIALRSTLHHIRDLEGFFEDCSRVLQPGGALVFEEPCREVFLLMAFCTNVFLNSGHKDLKRQPAAHKELKRFRHTAEFYLRTDIDKSTAEDKHLFTTEQLLQFCQTVGLTLHAYPNQAFERFTKPCPWSETQYTFESFFRMYLKYCMSFSAEALTIFDKHIAPMAQYVDQALGPGQRPMMSSVFLCSKAN